MVTPEYVKVERYIEGLSPQIKGMVTASNPVTIQAAIRMANKLMDQTVRQGTLAGSVEARNDEGKRRWDGDRGKNVMQYPSKRQEVVRTHEAGQNAGRGYIGNHPYCGRCGRHHPGRCTVVCEKYGKVGHMAKDCRVAAPMPITAVPMTCYECGAAGHFKRNCPKLRRQNTGPAEGRIYMITDGEDHQDLD